MTERGGPQLIPRPPGVKQGEPAPWSFLPPEQRVVTAHRLREVFSGRVGRSSMVEADGRVRPSAVLAPFYELDGELMVVLTRRSWGLRSHTGEVSFPGGGVEEGESAREAALREAYEEIRLEPQTVEILGELDHLATVSSRSFIVPYVALLRDVPELRPNPDEVDAVLHVPVRELMLDDVYREEHWIFQSRPPWVPPDAAVPSDGPVERAIFFFELVGDTVWGATAAMLRHLLGMALDLGVGIDHV